MGATDSLLSASQALMNAKTVGYVSYCKQSDQRGDKDTTLLRMSSIRSGGMAA